MTFTPGQKVVCITMDYPNLSGYGDEIYPTVGEVYTVREVLLDLLGDEGLLVNEIRNDRVPYRTREGIVDCEKSFGSWRFRPLVSGEKLKERETV